METENVCVSEGSIISLHLLMTLCFRINRFKTKSLGEKGRRGRAFCSQVIDNGNAPHYNRRESCTGDSRELQFLTERKQIIKCVRSAQHF